MGRVLYRVRALWILLSFFCLAASAAPKGAPDAAGPGAKVREHRWALVIGAGKHEAGEIPASPASINDAHDVADALRAGDYQEVRLLADDARSATLKPTLANVKAQVDAFLGDPRIGPDDLVVIYFSGQVVAGGEPGLALADSRPGEDPASGALPLSWLRDRLASTEAKHRMLLLDAPHAPVGSGEAPAADLWTPLSASVETGILTLTACAAGERACVLPPDPGRRIEVPGDPGNWEVTPPRPANRSSAFTSYVVQGLAGKADANRDRSVQASELSHYVQTQMEQWCKAEKVTQTPVIYGGELADFSVGQVSRTQFPAWAAAAAAAAGAIGIFSHGGNGATPAPGGTTPQQPDTGGTTPDQPGTGGTTPDQPGTGGITPDQPGTGGTTPDQPGTGGTTPDQPGTGGTTPDQPGTGGTTPDQPGTGGTTPDQPGTGGTTPDQPGTGGTTPDQPGSGGTTPTQPVLDTTPPLPTYAYEVDGAHLIVVFNEALDAASAQTPSNYSLAPGVAISGAKLQPDGQSVLLTIAPLSPGTTYTLTETGVKDLAGNSGSGSVTVSTKPDALRVVSAAAVDSTHADVVFNRPVDPLLAIKVANYALSPALPIAAVQLQPTGSAVRLTTAEQTGGATYTVTVSGVTDLAGALIGPANSAGFTGIGVPPAVVAAAAVDGTHVDVTFSEAIQADGAAAAANYSISPALAVTGAQVQSATVVRLTTAEQTEAVTYTVTVSSIKDLAANPIGTKNSATFTGIGTPPQVVSATAVDNTHADVLFNEGLDPGTAANSANYSISPSLAVSGAELLPDGKTVRLTTASQTAGTSYTVTVVGVKDLVGTPIGNTGNTAVFTGAGSVALSAGGVTPASGSSSQGFTYSVTYTDSENTAPAYVRLVVLNPDGSTMGTFDMAKADPSDSTYSDGCVYQWRSSILAGGVGTYSYRFEASDGTLTASPLTGSGPDVSAPGAGKILFTSARDGNEEIYVMNVDGSGQTRLTNNPASDSAPGWSPDGSRVCFQSNRDGNWEIYAMNADGSGAVRLTNDAAADRAPVWAPDGARIAFHSDRSGNNDLWVMNADGTNLRRLTSSPANDTAPAWSPDGMSLLFQSDRDGIPQLYAIGADGTGEHRVASTSSADFAPAWSRVGSRVLFASTRDGNDELYVMNPDGTGQTRLSWNPAADDLPDWSPDGAYLVYQSARDGRPNLRVMSADGSGDVAITHTGAADVEPAWSLGPQAPAPASITVTASSTSLTADGVSTCTVTATVRDGGYRALPGVTVSFTGVLGTLTPTSAATDENGQATVTFTAGTTPGAGSVTAAAAGGSNPQATVGITLLGPSLILFESVRSGDHQIWLMKADGTGTTQLTSGNQNVEPSWSPDGARVAFVSNRDGNWEVYAMDADGGNQTRLTFDKANEDFPHWSPDSTRIAYQSHGAGQADIWVMNADGTGQTQVTNGGGQQPCWSPDGQYLLFQGGDGFYLVKPDGTGRTRLTTAGGDHAPAWSPDGTRIAFASDREGAIRIYVMNADGSGIQRLTDGPAIDEEPAWSPDGTEIVFASSREGNMKLYAMNADGSNVRRLTDTTANDEWPNWGQRTRSAIPPRVSRGANRTPGAARLRVVSGGDEAFARLTAQGVEPEAAGGRSTGLRFVTVSGLPAPVAGRAAGSRVWEFTVQAPAEGGQATLSWPDLSGLGSRNSLILEDLDAKVRRSMRSTAGYTFQGGTRHFRVSEQSRAAGALAVMGLSVVPLRGCARLVRFTLTRAATVDLALKSPNGGTVIPITRARSSASGINEVPWTGTVAPGVYLLSATATGEEDGTAVQVVQPVVIVR